MARKSVHKYAASRRKAPEEVPATAFKDSCLQLIERVQQTREEIVVTKYGRPVAKLVAFQEGKAPLFGFLQGTVTIKGDMIAPLDEKWDAEGLGRPLGVDRSCLIRTCGSGYWRV